MPMMLYKLSNVASEMCGFLFSFCLFIDILKLYVEDIKSSWGTKQNTSCEIIYILPDLVKNIVIFNDTEMQLHFI